MSVGKKYLISIDLNKIFVRKNIFIYAKHFYDRFKGILLRSEPKIFLRSFENNTPSIGCKKICSLERNAMFSPISWEEIQIYFYDSIVLNILNGFQSFLSSFFFFITFLRVDIMGAASYYRSPLRHRIFRSVRFERSREFNFTSTSTRERCHFDAVPMTFRQRVKFSNSNSVLWLRFWN